MPRSLREHIGPCGREAAVVLFFAVLAGIATRPLALDLRGRTLAGPDPLIDLWTVNWLSGHLLDPGQVFQGNIFHPSPHAVLFSDLSLGTAVLVAPLRLFVHDPVPLYNLAVIVALTFSGWSFHALARDLTGNRVAGLLTGVLATFGSHQMSHVYHLNLISTGWLALFLLGLHRLETRPSGGVAVLSAVSFALAAQSSGYYAVAAGLLGMVYAAVRWRAFRDGRTLRMAALAALLAAVLTAPYLLAFLDLREQEGLRRPAGMSAQMAFRPAQDLGSLGFLYRQLVGSGGERLFPGVLSLALAAAAVARRRPGAGLFALTTLALLLMSLGPSLQVGSLTLGLPYAWLFAIPPFDTMRHPYTFAAVATFTIAVLAGIGWSALPWASRPLAGGVVVALAVLETLAPAPTLRDLPTGVPPAYERLAALPEGAVLEVPVFAEETMLWAARHGRPVLNGIGAFAPFNTLLLERYVRNHWIEKTPADVDGSKPTPFLKARFPVRYVILPVGRRPDLQPLAEAFDRSRSFGLVAEASDGDRIYEVRRD